MPIDGINIFKHDLANTLFWTIGVRDRTAIIKRQSTEVLKELDAIYQKAHDGHVAVGRIRHGQIRPWHKAVKRELALRVKVE